MITFWIAGILFLAWIVYSIVASIRTVKKARKQPVRGWAEVAADRIRENEALRFSDFQKVQARSCCSAMIEAVKSWDLPCSGRSRSTTARSAAGSWRR